jgi:putative peptidoglycan lipid II flippase
MSENSRFTKAAGTIGGFTLISRVLGFVRDMVIARFFGAGLLSDAFFVAFRLPNLLRRLFGEGSLTMAFIPVFSGIMAEQGKQQAFQMARSAIRLLSVLLVFVAIIGIFAAPVIVKIIAPGFVGAKFSLTVLLTRIMFPYIFFICLVALCMGILNVLGHFAAPAMAPILLNLSIIAGVLFLSPHIPEPTIGLAVGVLFGGLLQLLIQIPFLIQKKFYFWQTANFFHPKLKKIGMLMLPSVFGAAVYQINILVGTLLASFLPEGSVSYLYYADRLVQFPLGIFAISLSVAILPSLSRQASAGNISELNNTFAYALRLIFFITIPAMTGLILLRAPIITLLFERGAFDAVSSTMTAEALLYFSTGLWAFASVRIVVSTFYALQDTKTPVKVGIISVIVNILLGLILMVPLKHGGLALAASLSSVLNLCLLVSFLSKKLKKIEWKNIVESVIKSVICSALMGMCLYFFLDISDITDKPVFSELIWIVIGGVLIGIVAYTAAAYFLKCQEVQEIAKTVKNQ